jgi:transposase
VSVASASSYQVFVGVDIAAATFTAAWHSAAQTSVKPKTWPQTLDGFTAFQQFLLHRTPQPEQIFVVMEATGAYWLSLATFLVRHGIVVSVVNARQAHHFAKALLKSAKTDAIDAQTLTQLALILQPPPWTPPPAIYDELQQRLAQRDALLVMRNQITNQHHALLQGPVVIPTVRQRLEDIEQTLTDHIATIDAELVTLLEQERAQPDSWAQTITRLQSIPGVGPTTAMWIVASTLNFANCASAEQAVAYAGLAPIPRQSGTSVHKYPGIGHTGHARLRRALYLATLSAARYNPPLKAFYDWLRAQGKPHKVARCATARKLLHLAWAIATKGTTFDHSYQQRLVARGTR